MKHFEKTFRKLLEMNETQRVCLIVPVETPIENQLHKSCLHQGNEH